jgi:hypothetical protein
MEAAVDLLFSTCIQIFINYLHHIIHVLLRFAFHGFKLWPIVLQTYGTLEVREIRFPGEGHLQVHHSAAKVR